ncbi:MAG: hypothetical protein ABIR39_09515 [Nocardioides sp.]|uniref:hypothetical protein n=1 Tax=Nocardioides sp. TaxID=35761 RepID=UPI0032632971
MRFRHIVLTAALLPLLAACGGDTDEKPAAPETPVLEQAYEPCRQQAEDTLAEIKTDTVADDIIRLEDDGTTVIVSTPEPGGDIASGLALDTARCVLDETGAPATISEKMGTASAMSGPGEDSYDGISAEWSYAAGVGNAGFNAYFRSE